MGSGDVLPLGASLPQCPSSQQGQVPSLEAQVPYDGGQAGEDAEDKQTLSQKLARENDGPEHAIRHQIGFVRQAAGSAVHLGVYQAEGIDIPPESKHEEGAHHQDPGEQEPGEPPPVPWLGGRRVLCTLNARRGVGGHRGLARGTQVLDDGRYGEPDAQLYEAKAQEEPYRQGVTKGPVSHLRRLEKAVVGPERAPCEHRLAVEQFIDPDGDEGVPTGHQHEHPGRYDYQADDHERGVPGN